MFILHLIYIDDEGLPIPYFPGTGQCLVTSIQLIFGNLKKMNMQTDSNSVLGDIFESKVPTLITEENTLKLTIKSLCDEMPNRGAATFDVQPYSCIRLEPVYFWGVDFILQDYSRGFKTLIGIQVTFQAKNLKEKMTKTMQGFRNLCCTASNCNISFDRCICVLISPHWIDFDVNYDAQVRLRKNLINFGMDKSPILTNIKFCIMQ